MTSYFFTWLIPSLTVQICTYALFILGRFFLFTILTGFCTDEFSEKRVGFVLGSGITIAAIPGKFMYAIVDDGLENYDGNFWPYHLMCIALSIPVAVVTYIMKRKLSKS